MWFADPDPCLAIKKRLVRGGLKISSSQSGGMRDNAAMGHVSQPASLPACHACCLIMSPRLEQASKPHRILAEAARGSGWNGPTVWGLEALLEWKRFGNSNRQHWLKRPKLVGPSTHPSTFLLWTEERTSVSVGRGLLGLGGVMARECILGLGGAICFGEEGKQPEHKGLKATPEQERRRQVKRLTLSPLETSRLG